MAPPRRSPRADSNRAAILAHLSVEPASRADLARALTLSPALIGQVVKGLIADNLVREVDNGPSSGGRPAIRLALQAGAARAVGMKIAPDHVALVDVGMDGAVLRSSQEPFDPSSTMFLTDLVVKASAFIAAGDTSRTLLGIGVGVSGVVDEQHVGVVDSFQLGWSAVQLGPVLRRELGVPVLVDNNVNAVAMAEQLFGAGRSHNTFLTVSIGTGVGAAIVNDRAVLRGAHGGAGEFGHLPFVEDGERCSCGNRGCLETVIGQAAIERDAHAAGVIPATAGVLALSRAADRGDQAALDVFGRAGHTFGRALAGLVQVLDPELVVITGEGTFAWRHWELAFEPAFRAGLLRTRRGVPVAVEQWTDERWAQGAACLLLATPFDETGVSGDQGELIRSRLSQSADSAAGGER